MQHETWLTRGQLTVKIEIEKYGQPLFDNLIGGKTEFETLYRRQMVQITSNLASDTLKNENMLQLPMSKNSADAP